MSPPTAAGRRLLGAPVPAPVSAMPPAQAHSLRAMPSGSSLPMEPASVAPASTAMHAEGEVPLTSSASRDAAQCTNALQDDSSNSPELDPCESEGSCKLLWVCGTWPQHGPGGRHKVLKDGLSEAR